MCEGDAPYCQRRNLRSRFLCQNQLNTIFCMRTTQTKAGANCAQRWTGNSTSYSCRMCTAIPIYGLFHQRRSNGPDSDTVSIQKKVEEHKDRRRVVSEQRRSRPFPQCHHGREKDFISAAFLLVRVKDGHHQSSLASSACFSALCIPHWHAALESINQRKEYCDKLIRQRKFECILSVARNTNIHSLHLSKYITY